MAMPSNRCRQDCLAGMLVLLVVRDRMMLEFMADCIRCWGGGVLSATDQKEALEQAEGEEVHFVISDYHLSARGDGMTLISQVRQTLNIHNLPGILMVEGVIDIDEAPFYHRVEWMYKPVSPNELKHWLTAVYRSSINAS